MSIRPTPASKPVPVQHLLWPPADRVEPLRLRRAPLLAVALAFAIGIVLARTPHPLGLLAVAAAMLLGLAALGLRRSAIPGMAAALALWTAAGLVCASIQPAPPYQAALLPFADGLSRTVTGRIIRVRELPPDAPKQDTTADPPLWGEGREADPAAPPTLSVDLALDTVESLAPDTSTQVPVSGGVRIGLTGETAPLHCGDRLQLPLRLHTPERYRDPGAWQYADYLLEQGIGTHASAKATRLQILPAASAPYSQQDLHCRLFAAQAWASTRMLAYVHSPANIALPHLLQLRDDDAGMLNAMLFGDRTRLDHTLRLGFERTGSFHLFVVSGMHVALLAGGVFFLARRFRLPLPAATALTLALTAAYALLTGFGAPVQRALLMTTIFLLTRLLSRERSVLNALGAAALGVLILSPRSLFEASFQMTFLVILAIGGIAVPLGDWTLVPYARAAHHLSDRWLDTAFPPPVAQFRLTLRLFDDTLTRLLGRPTRGLFPALLRAVFYLAELAFVGIIAELVMILPMALYFHRATVLALPANIFSIPLVAVLAPTAILLFAASLLSPWAALLPGAATALLLHGVTFLIGTLSRAHGADLRMPGPAPAIALTALGIWLACTWLVRRSRRGALLALALLPLTAGLILWPELPLTTPDTLELTAIDVGQGDSLFLVAPHGETMLLDAGGPTGGIKETAEATSRFDVGEQVVAPYLWSRRLRRLDVLALSHAHSDHMGGVPAILRDFRPRELWVSTDPDSPAYAALLREAAALGTTVRHLRAGDTLPWGGTTVTVLAPATSYANPYAPANDDSLVLRLVFGQSSLLLAGDAEAASERAMLAGGQLSPVTLLKVGHHGSRTSTSEPFLAALHPRDAIISVGRNNTFGHPRPEVLGRLADAGTHLFRTDLFGLTTFRLHPDGTLTEIVGAADQP